MSLSIRSTFMAGAVLVLSALALAQSSSSSSISLPSCGTDCFQASCNSTVDTTCTCSEENFGNIHQCLQMSCAAVSLEDYYTSVRVLYDDCDIPRPLWSVDPDYTTTAIVTFVIQTAAYSMRVLARIMGLGTWGWDDHACAFAYVLCIVQLVLCVLMGRLGQYNNFWTLNFQNLSPFWKIDFSRAIAYAFALAACKTAILFLYQRVFERPGSRLRWVLWATHAYNVLLAISYMIQAFTIDMPLQCLWELDQESSCVYRDAYFGSGAYSALNALLDIALVIVPAVMVSRLNMSKGRKLSVIAVFATGTVTCLVAILRFALKQVQARQNLDEAQSQAIVWANYYAYYAELTCAFLIACLPACKQIFGTKIWPTIRTHVGSTHQRTADGTGSSGRRTKASAASAPSPRKGSFPRYLTRHLDGEAASRRMTEEHQLIEVPKVELDKDEWKNNV